MRRVQKMKHTEQVDGGRKPTSVGLKQSTSKSCKTTTHSLNTHVVFYVGASSHAVSPGECPTLTLAARSTSLGMSSSSSTSISSSGMASS